MDFELNDDQRAILAAVDALLEKHAGTERAIELQAAGGYDDALDAALRDAGFADVARAEDTGPLEAALVCEAVARAGGVVSFAAVALVVPGIGASELPAPVALATMDQRGPIRFGAHARTLLVLDRGRREVRAVALEPGDSSPVRSSFGYPMGSCKEAVWARGERLATAAAGPLESWWRLALAVEAVGTMAAALDCTVAYLKQRRQFGRETHQLTGAIGFTREHDLHVFSMRLQALRLELEGVTGHRRALARARWSIGKSP